MPNRETPAHAAREGALAQALLRVGHTVDGKYRLTAVLAVGGMGVVYEAQHLFLDRTVALKVLHPRYEDGHDAAKRFLREAATLGSLGHRSIVEVLDGGFVDGTTPYLVMEMLHGENLAQRIQRRTALRLAQAATVLREMMKGLAAAHAKGIVHCDLKPENVFLTERIIEPGHVKLLDFGVARIVAGESPTTSGDGAHLYGTPEYMAPEQIVGEELGPRTDLYGAGVVAFEALTGVSPFRSIRSKRSTIFVRVLRDKVPRLVGLRESIPEPFVSLVAQLMAKSPDERPDSAMDVLHAIDAMHVAPIASIGVIRAARRVKS